MLRRRLFWSFAAVAAVDADAGTAPVDADAGTAAVAAFSICCPVMWYNNCTSPTTPAAHDISTTHRVVDYRAWMQTPMIRYMHSNTAWHNCN